MYKHSLTIDSSYYIPREWTEDGPEVKKKQQTTRGSAWLNLMYPSREQTEFEQALSMCGIDLGEEHRGLILRSYSGGKVGEGTVRNGTCFQPEIKFKGFENVTRGCSGLCPNAFVRASCM